MAQWWAAINGALILDLVLPDGSGAAILDKVRDASLGTRVAVYAGGGDPMQLMRARLAGLTCS